MSAMPDPIRGLGRIHHVALVVRDLDASLALYRDMFGLKLETVLPIPSDRVTIAFLAVGESKVELVVPIVEGGVVCPRTPEASASSIKIKRVFCDTPWPVRA